jgi:hypothetical protein
MARVKTPKRVMGRSAAVTDFAEMVSAGGSRDFGLFLRALVEFVEHSSSRRVQGICLVADHERIIAPGTNAVCRGFSLRVLRTAHGIANFSGECLGPPRGRSQARQPIRCSQTGSQSQPVTHASER